MIIYLDTCTWCRPQDRKNNRKTRRQAAEVEKQLNLLARRKYTVVGSAILGRELAKTKPIAKLNYVMNRYNSLVTKEAIYNKVIFEALVPQATAAGITGEDIYHLCFAESAGADYLITVDDDFREFAKKLETKVRVISPRTFLNLVEGGAI